MDLVSAVLGISKRRKRRRDLVTVDIKVRMDCEGCEKLVKSSVSSLSGVKSVEVNRRQNRVTVTGYVDAEKVLKKVRAGTGRRAEIWPYVAYQLVYQPYAPNVYDKKAPPGFVRYNNNNNFQSTPNRSYYEKYTLLFCEDNTNACTIM